MAQDEVHEKSPNESVGMFFAWMAKKARNDKEMIYGRIEGKVYSIGPDNESIGRAFDWYLVTLQQ